ncbi:MAG: microtubule associated protein-domain-containing protein [Benniella sp.]|nr:MAG: microtubule associated protein-domain-containing protein [Benniella sp.]
MAMPNTLLHNTSPLPLDINIRPAVSLTGPTTIRLPLVVTAVATPPATPKLGPATVTPKVSPPTTPILQPVSEVLCHSPDSQFGDADQDVAIWRVLIELDRFVLKQDQLLLAAEIEDLMGTLEGYCHELGLDAANITHLLVLPSSAPITLTTRQALYRACDDLYQDILRRRERIERWVSRIIIIAENIREPSEPFLKTSMPPMSRARILQLEDTYRAIEKEWATVGKLRMRWIQCAYLPVDDYDHALCKLFERAELHDPAAEISYLQIEDPLCLSKECLASLSAKLARLDQNFYTRQSRIKAMEHALGQIYQDLGKPLDKRIGFRNEGTVRYAAELGRELKALQSELEARKLYLSGERWDALTAVWDMFLVSEQEREDFRSSVEQADVTFPEKLERIQSEIENCRVRFSKSEAVYKLMITRRKHIEEMISFEQRASDPQRLFQPSFQLVEEEKSRKRAYVLLLKLEGSLIDMLEKFESEHGEPFMYEGVRYLEILQAEIDERYVNETAFAKFSSVIAAPSKSQTIKIMGSAISPMPVPSIPARAPRSTNSTSRTPSSRSLESSSRRSSTLPVQPSSTRSPPTQRASLSRKSQAEQQTKSGRKPAQQQRDAKGSMLSTRSPLTRSRAPSPMQTATAEPSPVSSPMQTAQSPSDSVASLETALPEAVNSSGS